MCKYGHYYLYSGVYFVLAWPQPNPTVALCHTLLYECYYPHDCVLQNLIFLLLKRHKCYCIGKYGKISCISCEASLQEFYCADKEALTYMIVLQKTSQYDQTSNSLFVEGSLGPVKRDTGVGWGLWQWQVDTLLMTFGFVIIVPYPSFVNVPRWEIVSDGVSFPSPHARICAGRHINRLEEQ